MCERPVSNLKHLLIFISTICSITIEPENLKSIQAIDFKKWGLGTRRKVAFEPLLGHGKSEEIEPGCLDPCLTYHRHFHDRWICMGSFAGNAAAQLRSSPSWRPSHFRETRTKPRSSGSGRWIYCRSVRPILPPDNGFCYGVLTGRVYRVSHEA